MDETFHGGPDTQDLVIGPPRPSDISSILRLAADLGLDQKAWRSALAAQNLVCAKSVAGIAGVYVASHYSLAYDGDRLRELRAARNVLCNRFKLAEENVSFGAQAVIAADWQEGDLRGHLLRALLRNVGLRYHHLFRFCRKDNPLELYALQREGWRCYQEEDDTASRLVLRSAVARMPLASKAALNGRI